MVVEDDQTRSRTHASSQDAMEGSKTRRLMWRSGNRATYLCVGSGEEGFVNQAKICVEMDC